MGVGALFFGMFGLCTEIVFTGLAAGWAGSFRGTVSLLMIPVYALAYVLLVAAVPRLEALGMDRAPVRIPILVLAIYAVEWAAGAAYAAIGLTPWHYEHGWASDWSGGYVTLYYLPAWIVFAFLLLPASRLVARLALAATGSAPEAAGGRSGGDG
jgi:hypothetical protein